MLPLARALAEAGHDVAFASGEPVAGEAEAEGFTAFRVGLDLDSLEPHARRVRKRAASLPPSQVRPFVFTELFVQVELEPRVNDLSDIIEQWSPHVVVHSTNPIVFVAQTMAGFGLAVKSAQHGVGKQVFSVGPFKSMHEDHRRWRSGRIRPRGPSTPQDARTTMDPCHAG